MILNKDLIRAVTLGCTRNACKLDNEAILAPSGLVSCYGKLGCIFQHTFKVVSLILLKLIQVQHHLTSKIHLQ